MKSAQTGFTTMLIAAIGFMIDRAPCNALLVQPTQDALSDFNRLKLDPAIKAAGITTMEFEPGGVHDLREALERLIPTQGDYEHNRLNHDTNSHAHQRASVVGASEQVPLIEGRLTLGTWQQLVLIDFDDRPRSREVAVQLLS